MQIRRWHHFADSTALQQAVIERIADCAAAALAERGEFHCVLAGGRTPLAIYAQLPLLATDWSRWSIYFGDERCVPPADAQRNDAQARTAWLARVAIPEERIHPIPAEQGPDAGAAQYVATLSAVGEFDLVLLGLGEDGHTASLFPDDTAALHALQPAVAVEGAPKPPPQRVSMTAQRLGHSRAVVFIATGADKRDALLAWRHGASIPAAMIAAPAGVDIYTDQNLS